ncbi:MAG: copper resistance protein CopC/CopD [Candidatus Dormibacteraeota bacterium]|uniref:Copper resistance protein CopC/CopD n=1 Tax=Candidatus Nephthysia bennettiae TaxID=3127016 RepID=A0A934K4W9_9BACT|nr:copper resistance protein CopC/CopD [Candidatus Dormibacteraeota bacterium]
MNNRPPPLRRLGSLLSAACALASLAVVVGARPVEAHATVVASQPPAGERLSSTPGVVNLQFSEPLNRTLSHASVSTPDGRRFQSEVTSEQGIQIPLPVNGPGVYRVSWTTVSAVDGHVLSGGFEFGVGVSPNASGEAASDRPTVTQLALATARWVEFLGLLLAIGMLLLSRLGRHPPSLKWVRMRPALPLAAALAAGSIVVIGESLTAGQAPSLADVAAYLSNGPAGYARVLRLGAELVALLFAAEAGPAAIVAVGVALVGLAGAGHAASVRPAFVGVLVDALHLVAAGIWAGGILALAGLRPPGGWLGGEGRRVLDRFSAPALTAFAITVATGLLASGRGGRRSRPSAQQRLRDRAPGQEPGRRGHGCALAAGLAASARLASYRGGVRRGGDRCLSTPRRLPAAPRPGCRSGCPGGEAGGRSSAAPDRRPDPGRQRWRNLGWLDAAAGEAGAQRRLDLSAAN